MEGVMNNGYFVDPKEKGIRSVAMAADFKEAMAGWPKIVPTENSVINQQGMVLIKIPKTGTQTFVRLCRESFLRNKKTGNPQRENREVLSNGMAWRLWPNLNMLPRVADKNPWVAGGRTFLPEQLMILEWFQNISGNTPNSDINEIPLGGQKFKMLLSHWPWAYDPDVYRRVMISENPHTIAILRDPAERALSSYYYSLKRTHSSVSPSPKDFERFMREEFDVDYYCRWFSYPDTPDNPNYENAELNLRENITTVGTTERYNDFLRLCSLRFGLVVQEKNVNKQTKSFGVDDISGGMRKLLFKQTERDRSLYDIAQARLSENFENEVK